MVELQVDNFGNWEASAEWMRTAEDFRRDPIGSVFDPDLVLAAYQAGADLRAASNRHAEGKISAQEAAKSQSASLGLSAGRCDSKSTRRGSAWLAAFFDAACR